MGVLVVHLGEGQYVKWSNTTDAPVSYVLNREQLTHELETADQMTFSQAVRLLDLADEAGTSDPDVSLETLIEGNRAGPDESSLSLSDIIRDYRLPT